MVTRENKSRLERLKSSVPFINVGDNSIMIYKLGSNFLCPNLLSLILDILIESMWALLAPRK